MTTDTLVGAPPAVSATLVLRSTPTLQTAGQCVLALDNLLAASVELAHYRHQYVGPLEDPRISISLHSPLVVDIAGSMGMPVAVAASVYGIFRYIVKHPKDLGAALPKMVESWDRGWTAASRAKREREKEREKTRARVAASRINAADEERRIIARARGDEKVDDAIFVAISSTGRLAKMVGPIELREVGTIDDVVSGR